MIVPVGIWAKRSYDWQEVTYYKITHQEEPVCHLKKKKITRLEKQADQDVCVISHTKRRLTTKTIWVTVITKYWKETAVSSYFGSTEHVTNTQMYSILMKLHYIIVCLQCMYVETGVRGLQYCGWQQICDLWKTVSEWKIWAVIL